MSSVTIYTTGLCPYCSRAKELLKSKGVRYREIDVGANAQLRQEMTQRAGGRRTVPQIFIGETHIGGCDELIGLNRAGQLDSLLGLSR
jgi:glutaredoxin 3